MTRARDVAALITLVLWSILAVVLGVKAVVTHRDHGTSCQGDTQAAPCAVVEWTTNRGD